MTTTPNYQRWVSLGYVGAAVTAYLLFARLLDLVWGLANWRVPEWPLTPTEIIGMLCGVGCFLALRWNGRVNGFMNEAAVELAKVSWPPRKETALSTVVIAVVVALCALILTLFNVIWVWGVQLVY